MENVLFLNNGDLQDKRNTSLDIAKEKALDVILMDRENKIEKSKYKIINSLNNI